MSVGQFCARWENALVVLATGMFAAGLCFVAPTLLESVDYVLKWRFIFLAGR